MKSTVDGGDGGGGRRCRRGSVAPSSEIFTRRHVRVR